MSADSESSKSPEPVPPPQGTPSSTSTPESTPGNAEDTSAPEFLPQKRRYKKPEPSSADFDFSEGTDDEILILGTLLQRLLARKQAETEPESRRVNRFVQRNTQPLAGAPAGTAGTTDTTAQAGTSQTGASTETESGPAPVSRPLPKLMPRGPSLADEETWGARPSRTRGVLYFAFCAGLAIVAFLVGRSAAKPDAAARAAAVSAAAAAAATPAPQWNATLLGKLDQVLAADQNGNLQSAKDQAIDLKKQLGNSLELDLYIGTLTTRLGHTNDAEADLSRLLEPYMQPLQAAAVNETMAFTYTRRRDFKRAAEAFADASRINPFAPENFYRWGEVLRRQGRFQDAVDKFHQALQRLPEGDAESQSLRECAAFKLRLALIELGRDADVKPDIDNHLRQPSPGGYWLLTAAAFALQHGDMPGAVDAMQKARDALPSDQYAGLTDDYFFRGFAEKPELSHVLSIPSAQAKQKAKLTMNYFVDP